MLQNVWTFDDIHNSEMAPSYIHRIRNVELRHFATVGDSFLLVGNPEENISVFGIDGP